jgi:hypothetical protein
MINTPDNAANIANVLSGKPIWSAPAWSTR